MKDDSCIAFLQWVLPHLHMRWPGFRKVRGQVCKRIQKRLAELNLPDANAYRIYLENHRSEWDVLDGFCRITISRFYRDKEVFVYLGRELIPRLAQQIAARDESTLRVWSAGCGSGEEPFSLALLWNLVLKEHLPEMDCQITATDIDPVLLKRAQEACYPPSSVRELPEGWFEQGFSRKEANFYVIPEHQAMVDFAEQDIRGVSPEGPFHMVLCRNLAFTYFDTYLQQQILERIHDALVSGGALVIGSQESLPSDSKRFSRWEKNLPIFRKVQKGWEH